MRNLRHREIGNVPKLIQLENGKTWIRIRKFDCAAYIISQEANLMFRKVFSDIAEMKQLKRARA
jgi:hypothetical protein